MVDRESRDVAKFLERSPRKPRPERGTTGTETRLRSLDLRRDLGLTKLTQMPGDDASEEGSNEPAEGSPDGPAARVSQSAKVEDVVSPSSLDLGDLMGHPVYHQISVANGRINRMDLQQMKQRCRHLRLDSSGKREAVKRRLKEFHKRQLLIEAGLLNPTDNRNMDYLVVIDFEATCEERNPPDYQHEIIEFPAILISTKSTARAVDSDRSLPHVVDVFHSFCRPTINPGLSDFCRALTGIEQRTVDAAEEFPRVHERFLHWLRAKHRLGVDRTFAVVTDGPFDMGRFLFQQTRHLGAPFPDYADHWVNLRKAFANFYKGDFYSNKSGGGGGGGGGGTGANGGVSKLPGLQAMLSSLGMEFEGQPHSGLDDARNIARVVVRMLQDGGCLRVNEKIHHNPALSESPERYNAKLRSVSPVNKKEAELWARAMKRGVEEESRKRTSMASKEDKEE